MNGQASASQAYQEEAAAQGSRSRRSGYAGHEQTQKPSSSHRDSRAAGSSTTIPVRGQQPATSASTSQGPSREASEILNSMLVSPPEVDIERERERVALVQPQQTATYDDDATPPSISASAEQHGEETRRGGRSRHDFSKREKHTKFGEYILGNTIGEGEFGKVKLGWKQEGGVQVRRSPPTCPQQGTDAYPQRYRSLSSSSRRTNLGATRPVWPRSCVKSLSSSS